MLGTHNLDFILTRDGDDAVEGRGGNDVIDTGDGNDRIHGGLGADTMTGGAGLDAFVYLSANEGGDTVTDFQVGSDKFEIYAPGFNVSTLPANWFVTDSQATAANAQLIWNAANRTLSFDADGTGAGAAVVLATVGGSANLTQSDIVWTGLASSAPSAVELELFMPHCPGAPSILPTQDSSKPFDGALVLPDAGFFDDDPQIWGDWGASLVKGFDLRYQGPAIDGFGVSPVVCREPDMVVDVGVFAGLDDGLSLRSHVLRWQDEQWSGGAAYDWLI